MIAKLIGPTGATAGQEFVVANDARLGASPENEIQIVAQGVSRQHAKISRKGDQYWLDDAGATNGTFLNGRRIQRDVLHHLDVITLGRGVDLIFLFKADDVSPVVQERILAATLRMIDGPESGAVVELAKGELTLGRAPSCNIVLASPAVSSVHARLDRTASYVMLLDLQSANGTFVNGRRIGPMALLKNGDIISLARARSLVLTIEGDAPSPPLDVTPGPAFDQEWKTRLLWAPEELSQIEAARAAAIQLAALPLGQATSGPEPAKGSTANAAARRAAAPAAVPKAMTSAEPRVTTPVSHEPPPSPVVASSSDPKPEMSSVPAVAPSPATPVSPESAVAPPAHPEPSSLSTPVSPAAAPQAAVSDRVKGRQHDPATAPTLESVTIRGVRLVGSAGSISLGLGTFTVGRALGADVRVDDRHVSREHARIVVDAKSVTIEDLETVNGTLVRGQEIKGREPLRHGDSIQVGESEFKVKVITS